MKEESNDEKQASEEADGATDREKSERARGKREEKSEDV